MLMDTIELNVRPRNKINSAADFPLVVKPRVSEQPAADFPLVVKPR